MYIFIKKKEIMARPVIDKWIDTSTTSNTKHTKAVCIWSFFCSFKKKPCAPVKDGGRLTNAFPERYLSEFLKYAILLGQRDFANMMKFKGLQFDKLSWVSGNPNIITEVIRGKIYDYEIIGHNQRYWYLKRLPCCLKGGARR